MQAIIMAAGKGSRLGELTGEDPKAFLKINDIRMIDYNIALLHDNGIKNIILVTGYRNEAYEELAEKIPGVRCVYNPFYEMMNVLGSFYIAQHELAEDDTVYMHADTLCHPAIFKDMLNAPGDIVLPVDYKECDEEAMKVHIESGKVTKISKLIPSDESQGEFIGIAKLGETSIAPLKQAAKAVLKRNEFTSYFEGAIQEVIDEGKLSITTIPTDGRFWGEVDFKEDYENVCANMPDELVSIARKEMQSRT